ncbi:MAG: hypothetical protein AAFR81_29590 [Chloroflexota bacterium]
MRTWFLILLLAILITGVNAQDDDLNANRVTIDTQVNAFGVEEQVMRGFVINRGEDAYENVQIFADILNEDGDVIGEGFGFLVDQCGDAILDAPLEPAQERRFLATIDLFEDDDIDEIAVFPQGTAVDAEADPDRDIDDAVQRVAGGEVVLVEWEDDATFRYGVGCDEDVFTTYDWYRYDTVADVILPLDEAPNAEFVTDAFLTQTGITRFTQSGTTDDTLLNRSYLQFPTQSTRVVFQNDINTVFTSEVDGSFRRVIHDILSQFSLQGYVWSPAGNFVAAYFGAYGEPVQYFTASSINGRISALLPDNTPSVTIPGLTNDGRRVIISGTFQDNATGTDITGYYLSSAITQQRELLFEVDDLPGNNYPAPAYHLVNQERRHMYFIRPIEGVPTLQCYFLEGDELTTLTELPLQLDIDERAWSYLSPDATSLVISANGDHGGLWLVDLTAYPSCGQQDAETESDDSEETESEDSD